ncbi:BTAD domain-containing putative transcriptional regulator [Kribbella sp. HUAS MG21]|uniref:BTAD domain-containing putative transcriptional regulator n=1 Tax=Kribbella sp. HUAS MG21 TaxID=3160966 RepID=A0AAU7T5H6_9ACTN
MEFRILGPLEIVVDGRTLPTPAPRLCALLAILLLRPHRVVSVDELIDGLWPDGTPQPAKPTATVHTYVRRLRDIVGADVLQTRGRGYLLAAEPTDLVAFRSDLATASADPAQRVEHLRSALARWRGDPVSVEPTVAVGLNEERLTALEQYYDARLTRGEHAAIVPDLQTISAQEPLRERLTALLMTALYRSGRQSEALSTYDAVAERLVNEFGLDPTDNLRELRQAILTGTLDDSPQRDEWQRQNQLPLDIRDLIGRTDLVDEVTKLVCAAGGVPVVVLSGTPGIGKTAVAVRVAHQLGEQFPDGQWFVRLRGASDQPRRSGDVLVELLRTSGLDPSMIPGDLDARAGLFRARLAGRRVLLVLDDARVADQVRPLLPGTPGSAVIVTSRGTLDGLIALDGAVGLRVATLTPDDGAALIATLVDTTDDLSELVSLCAGLPLALRIAGANAARDSVPAYVARIRTVGTLPALAIDNDTAIGTAFRMSYDLLAPDVQRGFRLLMQFPGAEFGRGAAEALIGPGYAVVLNRLVTAGLLQPVGSERYVMHDLVKQYAGLLGEPEVTAWNALCSWYVGTADAAVTALFPNAVRLPIAAYDGVAPRDPAAWIELELANIEAVATAALASGPRDVVWLLADVVRPYLYQYSLNNVWRNLVELGLAASPDVLGRGAMLHALGVLARVTGDAALSMTHTGEAIELYREGGFAVGEAALLCNLGLAYNDAGRLRESADLLASGIALLRSLGETPRLPTALLNQSMNHLHLGNFRDAIDTATECLAIGTTATGGWLARTNRAAAYIDLGLDDEAEAELADRPGDSRLELISWLLVKAELCRVRGDHRTAVEHASFALRDSLEVASNYHECFSRLVLAELYLGIGELATAREYLTQVEELSSRSGYATLLADTRCWIADCIFREGHPASALELALAALAELEAVAYRVGEHHAHTLVAECCEALGRLDTARRHRELADEFVRSSGYVPR